MSKFSSNTPSVLDTTAKPTLHPYKKPTGKGRVNAGKFLQTAGFCALVCTVPKAFLITHSRQVFGVILQCCINDAHHPLAPKGCKAVTYWAQRGAAVARHIQGIRLLPCSHSESTSCHVTLSSQGADNKKGGIFFRFSRLPPASGCLWTPHRLVYALQTGALFKTHPTAGVQSHRLGLQSSITQEQQQILSCAVAMW